jgi:hypothetical protein
MNERIKELMWDAGLNSNYVEGFESLYSNQLEKFAGLIVAECMEVFSKDLPEPGDGRMLEVINRVCAVAEHFGVDQ